MYIIVPMLTIKAEKRDAKESVAKIRNSGKIPAVFYGPKEKSTPISVVLKDFEKIWKVAGESSVIDLSGDFGNHEVLIYDIEKDPIKNTVTHVDFYVIEKGKKIKVHVPVEFVGVSPAVKDLGGILIKVLHEVEVEAFPKDLPHELEADISSLVNFESQILASDIKLPSGVSLVTEGEEVIALASLPKEEKEEESVPVDLSSIEVEKKGKEDKEAEEAEAPSKE